MIREPERDESREWKNTLAHVARFTVQGGESALQWCCRQPENLTREHQMPQRPDLTIRVCRRCGRRHFTMVAEPGVITRP